ncbi:MAG: hypothetical protein Q7U57_19710 [Methylovulum sp.]|nr:hypothetical protein [Methylovulum sp.]
MRILCGSALAYWLSDIVNPAFVAVAVMILLFFPVFFADFLFPESPLGKTEDGKKEEQKEDGD